MELPPTNLIQSYKEDNKSSQAQSNEFPLNQLVFKQAQDSW